MMSAGEKKNLFTKREKREKYMPEWKTDMELFAPEQQIECGEHFVQLYDAEVRVTGVDGEPPHIDEFDQCAFSSAMFKNMRLAHLKRPTPIQQYIIPIILAFKGDILAHAPTGSGKTAAFLLPIIHKIARRKERGGAAQTERDTHTPYALMLAPTRELCQQLSDDARRFSTKTGVTVCVSYGGMPMQRSVGALREGCDIFIGTITRAYHFVKDKIISLSQTRFFVLDEMDRLIDPRDSNFEMLCKIKEETDINPAHRTFLFSATHAPEDVSALARFIDAMPNFIVAGGTMPAATNRNTTIIVSVGAMNRAVDTIEQRFVQISRYNKRLYLLHMLKNVATRLGPPKGFVEYALEKTIIFVARIRQSDRLAHELAIHGFSVISINGARTLQQRLDAVEKFSKGIYDILVATDVASRGINFPRVEHVVNMDLPTEDRLSYIHRLGRTGRVGNVGRATSFFDPIVDSTFVDFYIKTLSDAGQEVPLFMRQISNAQVFDFQDNFCVNSYSDEEADYESELEFA